MDSWVSWGKRLADEEVEEYHIIEEAYFGRKTNSALQSSIASKSRTFLRFWYHCRAVSIDFGQSHEGHT